MRDQRYTDLDLIRFYVNEAIGAAAFIVAVVAIVGWCVGLGGRP